MGGLGGGVGSGDMEQLYGAPRGESRVGCLAGLAAFCPSRRPPLYFVFVFVCFCLFLFVVGSRFVWTTKTETKNRKIKKKNKKKNKLKPP